VNNLGGEAYGFVGLAGNFVNYAALVTVALNSMASRFVSIEIYKGDFKEANKYFSSVFFANLAIALVMLPVFVWIVWKLEFLIEIPLHLMSDVKTAFAITFVQFLVNVLLARYEIATFVTNRLYLNQKNSLIASFLRLSLILLSFRLLSVRITYQVGAAFIGSLFCMVMNVIYTKRYLPELKLRRSDFDFSYIWRMTASGVWNLIGKLNALLLDGLDLLLSNLFIGPLEMGALALSKTVPTMFYSLRGTLDYPFAPPMTECYAKGDITGMIRNIRMGNKVLGIVIIAPIAAFSIYGYSFFRLWVPEQDGMLIHSLALLSLLSLLASSCINSVFTALTVVNKIRVPAFVSLASGIISVSVNYVLLKNTNIGIYAIAGTSAVLTLLRNYLFTPIYAAHCLNVKKTTFYREILTGNFCLVINLAVGFLFYRFISAGSTWITLILSAGSMAVVCIIINFFIVLSKEERTVAFAAVKKRLKRS
jgi:O-antigen/teichoic acid export membrane protein